MADDTELETLLSLPPKTKDLSRSSEVLLGHASKSASSVTVGLKAGYNSVAAEKHHPRSGTLLTSNKFSFPMSPSRTPLFSDVGSPPCETAPTSLSSGLANAGSSPHKFKFEEASKIHVPRMNPAQRKASLPMGEMSDPDELSGTPRWAKPGPGPRKHSHFQPKRDHLNSPPLPSSGASSTPLSPQHAFLTDVNDVKTMERNLLKLLDDFHSGKLLAFGQNDNIARMETIRKQQEQLARLHFDVGAELSNDAKDATSAGLLSQQRLEKSKQNMQKFTDSLKQLSISIEGLNSSHKEGGENSKSDKT